MVYTYTGASPSLAGFSINEIQNPEGRYVNGKLEYGYTDHIGNLRLSYKDSLGIAVITQSQSYDPWSNVLAGTEYQLAGSQADRYLVSGKESDNLTGNILLDWRDYDSVTGRMNSYDPADQSVSISGFAYAGNNPVMVVDPNGRVFFLAPLLGSIALGALKGAVISGVTTMISNGLHGRKFDTGLGQSMLAGAIGGGIAGGLGFAGSSIKGMESFARSSTYGAMKGVASDIGISAAMGNPVTFEGIASSLAGGFLDGAIPQFRGVKASNFVNLGLDLGISSLRGGARGALSSALQGGDIGQGFMNGAEGGLIGSAITNAYFGVPKLLTSDEKNEVNVVMNRMRDGKEVEGKIPAMNIGIYLPTFRSGGLHKYLSGGSEGFAMGNSLMSMHGSAEISTHEFTHYYQQMHQGWAIYFGKGLYEQWFTRYPYETKGTNEYNAQQNQLKR
jgi:RHS repeat-associated protein